MAKMAFILDISGMFHKAWGKLQAPWARVLDEKACRTFFKNEIGRRMTSIQDDLRELESQGYETRLIAALDSGKTWRNDEFPPYKAGRPTKTAMQLEFWENARGYVEEYGCELYESPGYEADDVIAAMATRLEAAGSEVRILSDDGDIYQLLTDKITVMKRVKDKWKLYDRTSMEAELGYSVNKVPLQKALAGCSSDNIPGVKNMGAVGALPYVRQYENTAALKADLEHTGAKDRAKFITAFSATYTPELFERLATLDPTIPVQRVRVNQ